MTASKKKVRNAFALMECAVAALNDRISEFEKMAGTNIAPDVLKTWRNVNTAELEIIEEDLIDIL